MILNNIWKCWHKLWDDTILCMGLCLCVCVCVCVCGGLCVCVCVVVCLCVCVVLWSGGYVTLMCYHSNTIGCAY